MQSAEADLQWHAVHRHEARRVHDGCARHRSGRQLLPSTTTATGDDAAAGPRRHPLTKAVLTSPAAAIRLVGTLHDLSLWGSGTGTRHRHLVFVHTRHDHGGDSAAAGISFGRMRSATTQDPCSPIGSSDASSDAWNDDRERPQCLDPIGPGDPSTLGPRPARHNAGPPPLPPSFLHTPAARPAIVHISSPGRRDHALEPGENPGKTHPDLHVRCPQFIH
jgi:hypothetical protein